MLMIELSTQIYNSSCLYQKQDTTLTLPLKHLTCKQMLN